MGLLYRLKNTVPPMASLRVCFRTASLGVCFRTAALCAYLYAEGTLYVSTLRFSYLERTGIHLLRK